MGWTRADGGPKTKRPV